MKETKCKRKKHKIIEIYLLLIIIATFSMSIVYAEISSVENNISGIIEGSAQDGVFITDINYISNNGADIINSSINYFIGTMFDSKIVLGNNEDSSITYEVTVYNSTDKEQLFIDTLTDKTDNNLYSNEDIGFEIIGLEKYTTILMPKTSITFTITFKYEEVINISNNILTCKLNFRFNENPILVLSNEGNSYELNNIYPDYTVQEYEFTIMNYEGTSINNVPMKYSLETTIDKPLTAKIYDNNGNEVTSDINIEGDGQTQVVHEYTLKIIWDNTNAVENIEYNNIEYADREFICNIILSAIPDDTKYMDYSIEKQFNVNITTLALNVDSNIDSTTGLFENSSSTCSYKISVQNNTSIPITYKVKGNSTNELNLNGGNINTVIQENSQSETNFTISPVQDYVYDTESSKIDIYVDIIAPYNAVDYKKYTINVNTYGTRLREILEKKYNINTSIPNFRENITTTTNSGVFEASEITGTAYYFRGVIDNNYVLFANKLWRIMRVNGDGTIRLILNSPIGDSMTYNYSTTSNNTDFNTSAVKGTLETWYTSNLQNYNQYINQNVIFLHDRRTSSASTSVFKTWERLYNASPLINTSGIDTSYIYTVNSNNGNGYLNYPIGLASSDEIMMAGAVITDNSSATNPSGNDSDLKPNYTFYIANGVPSGVGIWTISPFSSTAVMVFKSQVGFYKETPTSKRLVKPVIELNSNIEFKGNGTESNPYWIYK